MEGPSLGVNGHSFFLDSTVTSSPDLELYTDDAMSVRFGGYFIGWYFQGKCLPHVRLRPTKGISIEWQELFLIVVACTLWFPHFSGKRIQFWCDNELVVAIINSGHSKTPRIMHLLKFLVLLSMKHNFFVRAHHVPAFRTNVSVSGSQGTKKPHTILPSLMTLWQKRFRRTQSGDWQHYQLYFMGRVKHVLFSFAFQTGLRLRRVTFSQLQKEHWCISPHIWLILSSCL